MDTQPEAAPFTFEGRLSRSKSRTVRDQVAQARVTTSEYGELLEAAKKNGRTLGEWVREVLLREARRADDDALFTELVGTRLLLVNLIKPIITGQKVSEEWVSQAMSAVRQNKRKAAAEVRQQYRIETAGGQ